MKSSMRLTHRLLCPGALFLVLAVVSEAGAQPKAVKLTNEWKGSVEDANLQKGAPECITTQEGLEKLWKAWKLADKPPKVDFSKEIVIIGTTSGSRLNLSARLDEKGNLEILGIATSDFGPGFRYVIGTVPREGVKTVNKKDLPKE